jgi:hypothetical protein
MAWMHTCSCWAPDGRTGRVFLEVIATNQCLGGMTTRTEGSNRINISNYSTIYLSLYVNTYLDDDLSYDWRTCNFLPCARHGIASFLLFGTAVKQELSQNISDMSSSSVPTGLVIDQTTVLSLLSTLAILAAAYITSIYTLPKTANSKTRFLFIWHAFDALIHFILEGTFLYNCFFSYGPTLLTEPLLPANVHFLGRVGRNYGAAYGSSWHSALWREYAKADKRWEGTDLTVVSLEVLTVGVGGPLACWICLQLVRKRWGSAWFWMCVLATGELYGGEFYLSPFSSSSLVVRVGGLSARVAFWDLVQNWRC